MRTFFFRKDRKTFFRSSDGTVKEVCGFIPDGYTKRKYRDVSEEIKDGKFYCQTFIEVPEIVPKPRKRQKPKAKKLLASFAGKIMKCHICEKEIVAGEDFFYHTPEGNLCKKTTHAKCHEKWVYRAAREKSRSLPANDEDNSFGLYDFKEFLSCFGYKYDRSGNEMDTPDSSEIIIESDGLTLHRYTSVSTVKKLKKYFKSRFSSSSPELLSIQEMLKRGASKQNKDKRDRGICAKLLLRIKEIYSVLGKLLLDRDITEFLDPDDLFASAAEAIIEKDPSTYQETMDCLDAWAIEFRNDLREIKDTLIPENIPHKSSVQVWRNMSDIALCFPKFGYDSEEMMLILGLRDPDNTAFSVQKNSRKTIEDIVTKEEHSYNTARYAVWVFDSRLLFERLVHLCNNVPSNHLSQLEDLDLFDWVDRIDTDHLKRFKKSDDGKEAELVF